MEDSPAGKKTSGNTFVESPKKTPVGTTNKSTWSFGWDGGNKPASNNANKSNGNLMFYSGFNLYHNQSSILLGEEKVSWKREDPTKKATDFKKKDTNADRPVWNYNPKNAGKTTMTFGNEKPDYRTKNEIYKERTPTTLTQSRKK